MRRSLVFLRSSAAFAGAIALGCTDRPSPVESTDPAPLRVTAAQAPPTPVDPTPFPIEGFCAFDIQAEASGKAKTVVLPGGRVIALSPGLSWTLTNLDSGRRKTFVITGAFHLSTLESGLPQLVVTGRNILGAPGAGLSLVIGREVLVLDPESQLFLPVGEPRGRVIDLCELLG